MTDVSHKRRSSDHDLLETQMDYFFMNRKTDSELMTLLNILDCESGFSFACAVDKGPGDFLVSVICNGLVFCGRKRVVRRTGSEHAVSALSTAVCHARKEETNQSASMGTHEFANRLKDRLGRYELEQVVKIEINITDPIVARVVRHASWYRVKLDGYSPFRAVKGRPYGGEVVWVSRSLGEFQA